VRSVNGRAVLISGGGSGLGRAIALRLARGGAHVIAGDVNEAGAAETVRLAQEAGGSASAVTLNVADPESVQAAVSAVAEQFGRAFDGLVNNAGIDRGASILDLTPEQWNTVLGVNSTGPLLLTQAFLKTLGTAEREYPADVVIVSSISAITVGTDAAAYNASKAAASMLTKIIQREAHEYQWPVRVHGLMPSAMNTPMMEQWNLREEVMMAPDTVASAVEFMLTLPPDTFVQNLVINSRREPGWPR
jgi:NAD(P)-dependent dehydrogenase (short-subunit alcohol dehydrogenase family)